MTSPFNNVPFNSVGNLPNWSNDLANLTMQARQNPQAFEDYVRQTNPAAYQQAMSLRSAPNFQQAVLQMAQSRGIPPNVLRMLGIG